MIRFTSYELVCTVDEDAVKGMEDAIVSIKQDSIQVDKKLSKGEVTQAGNQLTVTLTQEETGAFSSGKKAYIQINILYSEGRRAATQIKAVDNVSENLVPKVVE